ncbi:MAG: 16S rRNA (adenine(1518)-N(6)/adenine(1519)-N(6))-dimethyltransferase RsmA [Pyrinomonadaceae bacterium]
MPGRRSVIPFAKKSFGQNFLVDQNYVVKIIDALNVSKDDTVIEIGPGRGALTKTLIEHAANVVAIELDRDMIAVLNEEFGHLPNFHLVADDALWVDFRDLSARFSGTPDCKTILVANLPYYISTTILQRLTDQRDAFDRMVLMFQREVVERITAKPGDSERGFLTVLVEAYLEVEKLFDVPPLAFRPPPKVWSSVLRLTSKPSPAIDPESFRKLVSLAFKQKRKTIFNNLRSNFPDAMAKLSAAKIDSARRAETLTIEEWLQLGLELKL